MDEVSNFEFRNLLDPFTSLSGPWCGNLVGNCLLWDACCLLCLRQDKGIKRNYVCISLISKFCTKSLRICLWNTERYVSAYCYCKHQLKIAIKNCQSLIINHQGTQYPKMMYFKLILCKEPKWKYQSQSLDSYVRTNDCLSCKGLYCPEYDSCISTAFSDHNHMVKFWLWVQIAPKDCPFFRHLFSQNGFNNAPANLMLVDLRNIINWAPQKISKSNEYESYRMLT